ncbi:hypothetical protein JXA84_04325 [candidate division WOR-3 bacterium]|nr:hypothetical protein [candidate division WOR-3 bacterium]
MKNYVCIAVELKTKCRNCDGTIHINALAEKILCPYCKFELCLSPETWKGILEDPIKDTSNYEEGEGTNSTVMGEINYQITYGKQTPRFPESKKSIDIKKIDDYAEQGYVEDPDTGKKYSLRKIPQKYSKIFPGALYLAMEDAELIPGGDKISEGKTENSTEPVAFACPKCGGFLDIDGKDRMVKCSFCNASVYLPDDLWMRLHPVKTITRWYVILNEKEIPYTWDSEIWDMAIDRQGDIFMALESEDSKLDLVSLDQNFKKKWSRGDLEYYPKTSNGNTKLDIDSRGRLMLWSGDRESLLFLNSQTGETMDIIGGKEGRSPEEGKEPFTMKNVFSLCADTDETFLVFHRRSKVDADGNPFYELLRFNFDGKEQMTWFEDEDSGGFFGKIKKIFNKTKGPQYFDSLKDIPTKFRDSDIQISLGQDGNYYLLSFNKLAKYSREGKKVYSLKLDCDYTYSKAVADKEGSAYVLSHGQNDRYYVLKISGDGSAVRRHLLSVVDGGVISSEETLGLDEKGSFYLAGYSGRMRIVSSEGKLLFRSEEAEKDEERKIEEAKR